MTERGTLANGVTLLCEPVDSTETCAIGFWFPTGSRDEQRHERGLSHFLEHMLFKGTERRSALEIALQIDRVGGNVNAFTDREATCFYCTLPAAHAELAGAWALTSEGRQGSNHSVLTVEQTEDGYTGSIAGRRGTREVSDLTVDGDSFSFTFMMRAPMGLIELTYNGTVSGDTLSGSISTPVGDRPFSGTRE